MNVDKKRLSKELKEAHPDVTLLASLATVGETPPGDGELRSQESKEMKAFLMSRNILPLQFELTRLKSVAGAEVPAAAAASAAPVSVAASSGKGKDIPFAPEGMNRWVGSIKRRVASFQIYISPFCWIPITAFRCADSSDTIRHTTSPFYLLPRTETALK